MIGFIPSEDDIAKQLERANELLIKSQAKMDGKKQGSTINIDNEESSLSGKRKIVTKNTTNDGLITTDGEMMAKLSENLRLL